MEQPPQWPPRLTRRDFAAWAVAGVVISALYVIDLPEHARRHVRERERRHLDEQGLHDVHRELDGGRWLMRDGSIVRRGEPGGQ